MSSPARSLKLDSKTQIANTQILTFEEARKFLDGFNDLVSRRAYELFDQDGQLDGNDVAHWLQAERELANPLPEVRESAGSFSTQLRIPEAAASDVKVYTTDDRTMVYFERGAESDSDGLYESKGATYYLVRWPEIVDPASCRAEIDGDELAIAVRKASIDSEFESKTGTESSEGL